MADIGEVIGEAIPSGSAIGLMLIFVIIGIIAIILVGGVGFLVWNKKRWNLKVEIKLPRSNGQIINAEWGKGYFDAKRGVVYIKRPGLSNPKIPMKIMDPKRYLQGSDLLTVVQLSPTDYRPIMPKSFLAYDVDYVDDKTGKVTTVREGILDIKCDTGASKAWQVSFEAAAKKAYSLQSFFQQFQTQIAIAIVVVAVFVGIAALWTQMPR